LKQQKPLIPKPPGQVRSFLFTGNKTVSQARNDRMGRRLSVDLLWLKKMQFKSSFISLHQFHFFRSEYSPVKI
jgi:hypothetical protein